MESATIATKKIGSIGADAPSNIALPNSTAMPTSSTTGWIGFSTGSMGCTPSRVVKTEPDPSLSVGTPPAEVDSETHDNAYCR